MEIGFVSLLSEISGAADGWPEAYEGHFLTCNCNDALGK